MSSEHTPPNQPSQSATPVAPARRTQLQFLLPEQPTALGTVLGGAGATYAVVGLLLVFFYWLTPPLSSFMPIVKEPEPPVDLVFLNVPGPGGGGGGGGNKSPEPPKTTPTPAIKPIQKAPEPVPVEKPVPEPEPPPPAAQVEAVPIEAPVAVVAAGPPTLTNSPSLGTGSGTGAGTGVGSGNGPGKGSGLGDGEGGNTGGGVYQVGSGVTSPVALFSPKPAYTSEAMLRRIQGEVMLSCVVLKTGEMGKCNIVKSLDSNNFGLDNEALKAASKFKFKPGTRMGEPVAVQVNIILAFNMR